MNRAEKRAAAKEVAKELMASTPSTPKAVATFGAQMALPGVTSKMVHQSQTKTTIYPFAEDLEAYNRAIPNGGERLFTSFEAQAAHRQAMENRVVDSNIRQSERGQVIALLLAVTGIASALYAALGGHDVFAGVMVTVVLAGGFGVFVTGRAQQQRDLTQKRLAAQRAGAENPR